jgi:WD40 repeat protein
VGGDDGVIRILDAKLQLRSEIRAHNERIYTLAFSPDGSLLASGGFDRKIQLIDRAGTLRTLTGHTQRVYQVAFSPDGGRLASASDDRTARVWEVSAGKELFSITGHTAGGVKVVAWFPDGQRLFTTGWDRTLRVWDGHTGASLQNTTGGQWEDSTSVHAGIVAVGGRLVVTGGLNKKVKVWDPTTQSLVADLEGHTEQISGVAVTADGRWLVSASHDNTARVWDLGAALRLARLGHQRTVRRLAWSADGKRVVTSAQDTTIRLWDAASGQELQRISPALECNDGASIATLPEGQVFGAGCDDGNLHWWRVDDRRPARTFAGSNGRRLRHATVAFDGSWIAAGHTEGWIDVWDTATGAVRASRKVHDHHVYALRALRDGTLLTASLDNTVRRSTAMLDPIATWRAPGIDGLLDAAIDPKERFIVAGGDGFEVFRWDLTKPGAPVTALLGHRGTVWSVDVSPDGTQVASASSDGTIRLWDTARWFAADYQPKILKGPPGGVLGVAFSPDGTRLASGHQKGAAIVWDLARGLPVRRLGSSEAGEQGTCDDLDSVAWSDPFEKATILRACIEPPAIDRLGTRTHLVLRGIDLVETWDQR